MPWEWEKDADVLEITNQIKNIKESFGLRLTCHPGQYSPLNTPNEKVLHNAINDFHYHNTLMNLVGGTDIITHVGGMYGDKDTAKLSFIKNYNNLSEDIKKKLRLENDDKTFTVEDVLDISLKCGVPICLDIHHHNCNSSGNIRNLIHDVMKSWDGYGTPKFHISTGKSFKTDRAHADYISIEDFLDFVDILGDYDTDIMFESKTKDLSVLNIQKSMLGG
ncbi:UV DNA damage endonuclease [compost metagenome]